MFGYIFESTILFTIWFLCNLDLNEQIYINNQIFNQHFTFL